MQCMKFAPDGHLLMVWNISKINGQDISMAVRGMRDVTNITLIPTADYDAPDIRIWDLDNIQNGEPIPPTIIEKLKEMVNAPVE